jgi:MEMO1 family protein
MRLVFIAFLSIFIVMETFPQANTTDRQPFAAGRFYPADKETLTKDIAALFRDCKKIPAKKNVRAIVSPHAGYVFSGKTAAAAFSCIPENAEYRNIFLIGSSHVMSFEGASVYNAGDYISPLGRIKVNIDIASKLLKNEAFNFTTDAHTQEHSLEVQIPFIQYYFKNTPPIVPIIIGTNNEKIIKQIAEALRPWFTPDNLFIISSDFSHYPPYNDAIETDRMTAVALSSGDPQIFLNNLKNNSQRKIKGLATSMCGWTSGLTLLYLAEGNKQLEFNLIDYTNSGDSPYGGKNEVVGYNAISLTDNSIKAVVKTKENSELSFTGEEKAQLFQIARNTIISKLDHTVDIATPGNLSAKLSIPMGAFVTIKFKDILRGCIGRFVSTEPLYEVIKQSAISSAFEDPRFPPVAREEFSKLKFEITVLGPLKKIEDIREIVLGKHGIYIKKDMRTGTMLPQVATENGWTAEEFLGYTSRDKAGLGWDGWKDADLFIFEGLVLEETP